MKKSLIVFLFSLLSHAYLFAQTPVDTSWKSGGFFGLNFSQINLSEWAPGGENSISLSSTVNLFANYVKGNREWANSLDLGYAMVKTGNQKLRKSDDKIEFNSKYGVKFKEKWLYSFLVNLKSQFAPGYNYPDDATLVSQFFAPGFLTASLGITYKPVEYFEVFISPATGKFTIVSNQRLSSEGAYGVDTGRTVRSEFGAYFNLKFKKDILENVNLSTKLELFDNYTDKVEANRSRIDVNWETAVNMTINNYLTASITTQLVYDANVVQRTQFKEVLGIGIGIKF